MALQSKFRVIIKEIPGDASAFLVAPYPQVVQSAVRPYRIVPKNQIAQIDQTGDEWTSMGRTFPIVDITIRDDATVPLQ
jgi:hypothetical protein